MFKPLEVNKHPLGESDNDCQKIYRFDNGFGASVVHLPGSYGYSDGLSELAVIKFESKGDNSYSLTYDTPVTSDVKGWLTEEDVQLLLKQISDLQATS